MSSEYDLSINVRSFDSEERDTLLDNTGSPGTIPSAAMWALGDVETCRVGRVSTVRVECMGIGMGIGNAAVSEV